MSRITRATASSRRTFFQSLDFVLRKTSVVIWKAASAGVAARPVVALAVLSPVNEVIDLHTTRVAAGRKHLPLPVTLLLVTGAFLAIGVIGYGNGLGGERAGPLAIPLAILIGSALWITIDLDHPRAGVIRLNDAPLMALKFERPPG